MSQNNRPKQPFAPQEQLIEQWKREERQPFTGWNFSHLAGRWIPEQPPWSYEAMTRDLMIASNSVLDLGTRAVKNYLSSKRFFRLARW